MTNQQGAANDTGGQRLFFLTGLYFLSGVTGLVLQVVWLYRLGLVFGNAAYATAATLAAFFLGIAIGGWYIGNASTRFKRPLTGYGLMEIGIALTALLWLPAIGFYEAHYAGLVGFLNGNQGLLTVMKFLFSTSLLLLPTVLMGGTFPVLAQYVGAGKSLGKLASRGTVLYAVNTLGASLGAFLAGFFLIRTVGVKATYNIAMLTATAIGFGAIILDRLPFWRSGETADSNSKKAKAPPKPAVPGLSSGLNYRQFVAIAFASGLLALAAETIWTRMFAQVLQNSVYSFSAILVVFLIALGVGGLLAHILVRLSLPVVPSILGLLLLSALLIGLSPLVFNKFTDGLSYLAAGSSWAGYLKAVFKLSFIVVFPPTMVLGAVFPYLLKAAPGIRDLPGRFVGKLVLLNALGGTVGPILAGFFMLDLIGLWNSLKIIAMLYAVVAYWLLLPHKETFKTAVRVLPLATVFIIIVIANPPLVRLGPGQKLLATWQSSDGVLTVVESAGNIQMRLNNFYVLGDSHSALVEQMQAHVPLLLHPSPGKTLFLGMGTGITAGAALNHEVDKAVVVELVAKVIPAAKKYFSPWTNGLFTDNRVQIISDDARNYLLGSGDRYDVIIGDLFTPWHAGTGSLYTIEHFQQARAKLQEGGLFAQWLPLYQLTPESFDVILATFTAVFPQVTLWRADFSATGASIVLIGQEAGARLSQQVLQRNIVHVLGRESATGDHMAGLFYLGNAIALKDRLATVKLNTDDQRTIEYQAPVLAQEVSAGKNTFVVGQELTRLFTTLATNLPPAQDPYLAGLPPEELRYVDVGLLYFRYLQLNEAGNKGGADSLLVKINNLAPDFLGK